MSLFSDSFEKFISKRKKNWMKDNNNNNLFVNYFQQLFEKLRRNFPHALSKIVPVAGDVTEQELGISEADRQTLIQCVSIVFHSAATVKFDEALKLSVTINILGTQRLIQLCHRMHKLEVRTFFS